MEHIIQNRIEGLEKNKTDNIVKNIIINSLVDIKIIGVEARIKEYDSVIEKINRKNYKSVDEVKDLLGIRIICESIDEIYKVKSRIMTTFENCIIKDYIQKHKHGYRGIHIYNKIDIKEIKNIPLEIQIKTMAMKKAQDKTHDKIYKNKYLPNFIKKILNFIVSNNIIIKEDIFSKERLSENYM